MFVAAHRSVHLRDARPVEVHAAGQVRILVRQQPHRVAGAQPDVVEEDHSLGGPRLVLEGTETAETLRKENSSNASCSDAPAASTCRWHMAKLR